MAYNFSTFGNVVDDAFDEIGVDSGNSMAGLTQAEMEDWGNRFAKLFIEKCKVKSQEDTYSFRTLTDSTISAAAASAAVSLTTASTVTVLGYPTSGMILLDHIPYTFSAFTTTTMTVEALDRAYASGDTIQIGYSAPTNFGKPITLTVDGARFELQKWGRQEQIESNHFAIIDDYIFLPEAIGAALDVTLHFYTTASNTLTTASNMELYQMWDQFVVYKLAARGFRLLYYEEKAQMYENLALQVLAQARQQAAEEDMSPHRGFVPDF